MGTKSSNGISLFTILGVVFIILKLCHVIDWSWWWVTAPFWGGVLLTVILTIVLYILDKKHNFL